MADGAIYLMLFPLRAQSSKVAVLGTLFKGVIIRQWVKIMEDVR